MNKIKWVQVVLGVAVVGTIGVMSGMIWRVVTRSKPDHPNTGVGEIHPQVAVNPGAEGLFENPVLRRIDPDTGCEYLLVSNNAITPRLTAAGTPYCHPPEKK